MDINVENPWKVLSTEKVYENPWIGVEHHEVMKPNGEGGIYGVVHFKNIATGVIALDEEKNIYLVGQYRYPLKKYSWEIPEGGCPEGENPLEAAKRELLEETGLKANHWKPLLKMDLSDSVTDEQCEVFLAKDLEKGNAQPEDTEILEIKKIPFGEAVEWVMKGKITDAVSVAAILKMKLLIS